MCCRMLQHTDKKNNLNILSRINMVASFKLSDYLLLLLLLITLGAIRLHFIMLLSCNIDIILALF